MPWACLPSLDTLLLSDVKRLYLSTGKELTGLAALPNLALVDVRNTLPGDSQTMVTLFNLALALRTGGLQAQLLM
jgi:hypothetical protein